ncbi:MAG: ABC transporter ATP-binding protein [Bacillota bacterium]|nr:ABC transporter ATP-binding protein [Bacillota bacterium]
MSVEEPIISFENITKTYTLYKSDQERFKALFLNSKHFKKHIALNDISFQVKKGESVGIIGDNGAGKSTILKMITGVTYPDTGSIVVRGKVAALLELTAGFSLEMTGRENIYLKGYILGLNDKYIATIEQGIIDFAELGDYIDQPVRTYSSGMKMRLGFAINISIDPDILVIDEALSVGDGKFQKKCKDKIAEVIGQNKTVLFVSHSMSGVKEVCQRAIYLKQGKIMFDGSVDEAFEMYQSNKAAAKK